MSITNSKRRGFLKLGLGGIVTGAVAPHLWLPRIGRAHLELPSSRHNHLVVINLDGGARSVPMFNGDVDGRWNPYGTQPGSVGTEWGVGAVWDNTPYTDTVALGMPEVPALTSITHEIAVIGTIDHTPGAASGVGDHVTARAWIGSGRAEGGAGVISHIYAGHKNYTEGGTGLVFPPVVIGTGEATTPFGAPAGSITPVMVPSFSELAQQGGDAGGSQPAWARALEAGLDGHSIASRSNRHKQLIRRLSTGKENVEAFKGVFLDPALKLEAEPNGERDGLTNAQLGAIFGTTLFGRNAALALRFLSYGSAAVLIGDNGWDTHSGEMPMYEASTSALARVISGFNYALKRMAHPEGGTYWDHTLICMITEFGRDNTMEGGFNSGGGSDHTGGPASRYQAWFATGGLVGQGGKQFGRTDPMTIEPLSGEPVFSTTSWLATMLRVLDVETEPLFPGVDPVDVIF
jgi:hypothetical protein